MSEKNEAVNMFSATDPASCFYDILAKSLETMMSQGNHGGCLELIKFTRRFVTNTPITDYRTVGFPESIKSFLEACGLKMEKDFNIEQSSLDANSYVFSFVKNDKTNALLGCFAGMRIANGPSVSDRLYCEMCKDEDRNFKEILSGIKSGENGDIREYVLERTAYVYDKIVKLYESKKKSGEADAIFDKDDLEIVEFARSQMSNGKLLPDAVPVVPLAVAELYVKITDHPYSMSMFRLGKNAKTWISARPISSRSFAPSHNTASVPVQVLRKFSRKFDAYMPSDAYEFYSVESSGNHVTDVTYVTGGSLLRFPRDTPENTVTAFNILNNPRDIFSRVYMFYEKCYPDLGCFIYSGSGVRFPVGSKYTTEIEANGHPIGEIAKTIDADMGLEVSETNPELVLTYSLLMSPKTRSGGNQFNNVAPLQVSIHKADSADTTKKPRKGERDMNIAEEWFKLVHNVKSIPFTEKDGAEKIEEALVGTIDSTDAGMLPTAIAIAVRSAITRMIEKFGMGEIDINAYLSDEEAVGLHTKDKFITQLISTVTGSGARSMTAFVKEMDNGKSVTAPEYPMEEGLFPGYNATAITKFIKFADTTGIQTRAPRKLKDFVITAETNIRMSAVTDIYESTNGFTKSLEENISKELTTVLFKDMIKQGREWSRYDKIVKTLGSTNAIVSTMKLMLDGAPSASFLYNVALYGDKNDRTVISIRVDRAIAFLALLAHCDDASFAGMLDMAVRFDPASIFLSEDKWMSELCDTLLDGVDGCNRRRLFVQGNTCSKIYDNGLEVEDFTLDTNPQNVFSSTNRTERFQNVSLAMNGAELDPN